MKSAVVPFAICLAAGVTAVLAHEGAHGIVAERMEAMKSMGSEMKALAEMLKDPESFERDRALRDSAAVASHAKSISELFPEGSNEHPSKALPAIWGDWDVFAAHATDLHEAALAFEAAAEAGAEPAALRPVFEAMAKNCLACHEDFRQPGGGPAF